MRHTFARLAMLRDPTCWHRLLSCHEKIADAGRDADAGFQGLPLARDARSPCAPIRACYEPSAALDRAILQKSISRPKLAAVPQASRRREANYGVGLGFDHATSLNEALTFDDVLLLPGHSAIAGRGRTEDETHVHDQFEHSDRLFRHGYGHRGEARDRPAQAGGIGVIHRNFDPVEQAEEVARSSATKAAWWSIRSRFFRETLADALALMRLTGISGIPVVERGPGGKPAKLCGILTNRDVRFADTRCSPSAN